MAIYLVRHGESESNVMNIFYSRGNKYGLTRKGRDQAYELAKKLKGLNIKFDKIISSSLLRATDTADIIAAKLNMEYEITENLKEVDTGELEETGSSETVRKFNEVFTQWLANKNWDARFKDGESFNDVIERFLKLLKREFEDPDKNILLVTHGGLIMCVVPYLCKNFHHEFCFKLLLKNAEYTVLQLKEGNFQCVTEK